LGLKGNENEKAMWREIEYELQTIQVGELGYDHPFCSGILHDSSLPIN
ncbi:14787_t:CDS:1, partial [Dentiscutata erythropus]